LRTKEAEADLANYIEWRNSNVICILDKLERHPRPSIHILDLMRKIESVLLPYTDKNAFGKDLRNIILKAAVLDADMWKQKAYYYLSRPGRSGHVAVRFDPGTMELYPTEVISDKTSNPFVTLIISPTLTKYGDSNGTGYSRSTMVAKCVVSHQAIESTPGRGKAFPTWRAGSRSSDEPSVPPSPSTSAPADLLEQHKPQVLQQTKEAIISQQTPSNKDLSAHTTDGRLEAEQVAMPKAFEPIGESERAADRTNEPDSSEPGNKKSSDCHITSSHSPPGQPSDTTFSQDKPVPPLRTSSQQSPRGTVLPESHARSNPQSKIGQHNTPWINE
jgi:hypothetical protein